jgi:hypothetical protein
MYFSDSRTTSGEFYYRTVPFHSPYMRVRFVRSATRNAPESIEKMSANDMKWCLLFVTWLIRGEMVRLAHTMRRGTGEMGDVHEVGRSVVPQTAGARLRALAT